MQHSHNLLFALAISLGIAGCSEPPPVEQEAVSRPVKTIVIGEADLGGSRSFPARIAAAKRAELAFRVPGTVQDLPIKEGDRLEQGDLVARLDPTDFQIVVNDRQATFDKASKNFERGRELVGSGAISRSDFDRLEAEFKNARAALAAAQQDLAYTELTAPFKGMVARRLVQRFEEVQAKQPVVQMQNIERLEVKFDVPESIIRNLRADSGQAHERIGVYAMFEGQPGRQFPLEFKEISTKADETTQTFEATYLMEQWERGTVLPGMTATVTVDLSEFLAEGAVVFSVPVSAVVGDYKLSPQVWVVDEASMTVSSRPVKVGRLVGNGIQVLEGLEPGMRLVTAGTPFLVEGMQVSLLPELEQAQPRPDDLKYQQ
jgi:RND family efflux transporter MFP subunit